MDTDEGDHESEYGGEDEVQLSTACKEAHLLWHRVLQTRNVSSIGHRMTSRP